MRSLILLTSLFLIYLFQPIYLYAQVDLCPGGNFKNLCVPANKSGAITTNILTGLLAVAIILSVIFLVWGGIKWITAGGDKQALDAARSQITSAIVGLVLAFAAFFIFQLLLTLFGLSGASFDIPKLTS